MPGADALGPFQYIGSLREVIWICDCLFQRIQYQGRCYARQSCVAIQPARKWMSRLGQKPACIPPPKATPRAASIGDQAVGQVSNSDLISERALQAGSRCFMKHLLPASHFIAADFIWKLRPLTRNSGRFLPGANTKFFVKVNHQVAKTHTNLMDRNCTRQTVSDTICYANTSPARSSCTPQPGGDVCRCESTCRSRPQAARAFRPRYLPYRG